MSLGIALEAKGAVAEPREEIFILGREEGRDRVTFIEFRIGRGVAFGSDEKNWEIIVWFMIWSLEWGGDWGGIKDKEDKILKLRRSVTGSDFRWFKAAIRRP